MTIYTSEHWPAHKNLCIDSNIDNMQLFLRENHQGKNNEALLVCRQCLDENRSHRKQGKLDNETIVLFKNYIDDGHSESDDIEHECELDSLLNH